MSLAEKYPQQSLCSGSPFEFASLSDVQNRIEDFLRTNLPAIASGMKGWTDNKASRLNEKVIASNLCIRLNYAADDELFRFHHEDPQNKAATRTLDMGTYPRPRLTVVGHAMGPLVRLYGIEAKRLPTPNQSGEIRLREYVVGRWESKAIVHKSKSGGIERFKEGMHGEDLDRAAMFGFVQSEGFNHWHSEVNGWIDDLITSPIPSHQARWENQDRLAPYPAPGPRVAELRSDHARANGSAIRLTHFWLDLTGA